MIPENLTITFNSSLVYNKPAQKIINYSLINFNTYIYAILILCFIFVIFNLILSYLEYKMSLWHIINMFLVYTLSLGAFYFELWNLNTPRNVYIYTILINIFQFLFILCCINIVKKSDWFKNFRFEYEKK